MRIALLAERLRVEERLLIDAFGQQGHDAQLVAPSTLHAAFGDAGVVAIQQSNGGTQTFDCDLALDRGPATTEHAALGALIASRGVAVVNRPATSRLLADRLAAVRHLTFAGIPLASTVVSFGEAATFSAIESLGYPVLLKSIVTDHGYPTAIIEDRDAAEAIIEHRVTLGDERGVLVQRLIGGSGHSVRLVIIGDDVFAIEQRQLRGWRPGPDVEYEPFTGNAGAFNALGRQVIERLGSGTYSIEVVESNGGPVVVGLENLVDFRTVAGRDVDIAGAIAEFALSQAGALAGGERVG